MKENLQNELAFFGGYTNGYIGYLPTKEKFLYGGYEVELSPVVYGSVTNLLIPPEENTGVGCEELWNYITRKNIFSRIKFKEINDF